MTQSPPVPVSLWPFVLAFAALVPGMVLFSWTVWEEAEVSHPPSSVVAELPPTARTVSGPLSEEVVRHARSREEPRVESDPVPSTEGAPVSASALNQEIADWRYVGHAIAGSRSVAVVERARDPGKTIRLLPGTILGGVKILEVNPRCLQVAMGGESVEIVPTTGPAFDLDAVEIPSELADEPEALAEVVYRLTLGAYQSEHLNLEDSEEVGSDAETVEALASELGVSGVSQGQSLESWASGMPEDSDLLRGQDAPLSEQKRLRLLGL